MKRNHRTLCVWQEGIDLVMSVYHCTKSFPRDELFGLSAQMRRAAISVPSNIAEGFARSGTRELMHFLSIAVASLSELDTQVEIARRLDYLSDASDIGDAVDRVSRRLAALIRSLKPRTLT